MNFASGALLVPIVAVGGFWAVVIVALVFWHRERMARIRREAGGTASPGPPGAGAWSGQAQVERGIRLSAIGVGIVAGLGTMGFGPWLLGGLIPFVVGAYQVAMVSFGLEPEGHPSLSPEIWLKRGIRTAVIGLVVSLVLLWIGVGPWLLGGFIPLAVGLGDIGVALWWERVSRTE
ncbi:MAG: hypothetical protein ACP5QO_16900 [Clostridia bacterium]